MNTLAQAIRQWHAGAAALVQADLPRRLVSAVARPFWPTAREADWTSETLWEAETAVPDTWIRQAPALIRPALEALAKQTDLGVWRRLTGHIDVNATSGELFADNRPIRLAGARHLNSVQPAPADLIAHLRGRRVVREPMALLYNGIDTGMEAFACSVLPRFFMLDRLSMPKDTLCTVSVAMGMTGRFQDALSDGLFRPRPIELQRRDKFLSSDTVHVVEAPLTDPVTYSLMRDRLAAIYGLPVPTRKAVFVCRGGARRAARLFRNWTERETWLEAQGARILDPEAMTLRRFVAALGEAETLIAPDTGEAAAAALRPALPARVTEWATSASPSPRRYLLCRTLDVPYALQPRNSRLEAES